MGGVGDGRVDVAAALPHYAAHLRPVWDALPDDRRGTWWGPHGDREMPSTDPTPRRPLLVASYLDAQRYSHRPVILLEHGAGQSYGGDPVSARHPSYAGGDGWDHALAFLSPSEQVADRWRARYPSTPAVVVGAPVLDRWHGVTVPTPIRPLVVIAFHWDCLLVPETRSAWWHYEQGLAAAVEQLTADGFRVAGHSHPRWRHQLSNKYRRSGITVVDRFDDVMASASVLVADNSSAMYEFAATDRPVVALNAPWYRHDVDHGLRFWSHVPGVSIDHPSELALHVQLAYSDDDAFAPRRRAAVAHAYAHLDGRASERAASAVLDVLDG